MDATKEVGFLAGGGEMGELIRTHDWASHPLGRPEAWPQSLRTGIRLLLKSDFPLCLLWGPELYCFYNDAVRAAIGPERHPSSLARPARETWWEIWDVIGPKIRLVMSGGDAPLEVDALVPITRYGQREDAYWTYAYGPIYDEGAPNGIGGALVYLIETTRSVMAEQRLVEQSQRQQRLFESAPAFICLTRGPEHVVEFVNQAHRTLFESADWVGRPMRDACVALEGDGFAAQLDEVYATGEPFSTRNARMRIKRSEGPEQTLYLTFTFAPWIGEDGAACGVFCLGFDVTEARAAEDALLESQSLYRLAVQASAIGTWDRNLVTGELRWGPRCKELFGLPHDAEVTYETFLAGLHPDDRESVDASVKAALAPGGSGTYDAEYRTIGIEDGVERWLKALGHAFYDDGKPVRFVGTVTDITQSKRAARRLEIVSRVGAAVAAELDLDTIVQAVTDAGVELTGAQCGVFISESRVAHEQIQTLYCASCPTGFMRRNSRWIMTALNEGGSMRSDDIVTDPRCGEMHVDALEGEQPIRSLLAVPVASRSGDVHGALVFGHGEPGVFQPEHQELLRGTAGHAATAIDNARLVRDLKALNANLEQRVAAEVSDRLKAEGLLHQAQKLEAMGQLTGGVAHDFNNLLMVVSAGLNVLERSDDPDQREVLMARMHEAVKRGATLTQQLLAFSRKQDLKPEVVAFADHLAGMGDLLCRSLGGNTRIETDVPKDLAPIYVDQTALQLAILNLAVNARDAMPQGGTIVIRARNGAPDDPDAPSVSISVVDKGVGMSRETQSRIFEPFFTTKTTGKGSGLGLAQVHGFAQQSGGRVDVESALGGGSTITLVLPKSEVEGVEAKPDAAASAATATPAASHALLVEDDDDVAAMIEVMLEHLGWRVTRARSAEAALVIIASGRQLDLVLSDVMMPGGRSGLDLAYELQAKRPDLPMVLTSGYSAAVKRDAETVGLTVLPKPFNLDTLAAAVDRARRTCVA